MNILKKIKLFASEDLTGSAEERQIAQQSGNNLKFADDIDILRMVYFDEFFLFLSIKNLPNDAYVQYLYVTKQNMELTPERTF